MDNTRAPGVPEERRGGDMGEGKGLRACAGHWLFAEHFTDTTTWDLNLLAQQNPLENSLTVLLPGPR